MATEVRARESQVGEVGEDEGNDASRLRDGYVCGAGGYTSGYTRAVITGGSDIALENG